MKFILKRKSRDKMVKKSSESQKNENVQLIQRKIRKKRNKIDRHRGKKTQYKSQEVKNAKEKAKRMARRIKRRWVNVGKKRKASEL